MSFVHILKGFLNLKSIEIKTTIEYNVGQTKFLKYFRFHEKISGIKKHTTVKNLATKTPISDKSGP